MSKKDKLLTLSNDKKYVIVEECEYNGDNYCFACEIVNDDVTENYKILKIGVNSEGKEIVSEEKNDEILKSVCKIFDDKLI